MSLRRPLDRMRIAHAVSHQDIGAAHPAAATTLSFPNRTRRGTNVSLGWLCHHGAGNSFSAGRSILMGA